MTTRIGGQRDSRRRVGWNDAALFVGRRTSPWIRRTIVRASVRRRGRAVLYIAVRVSASYSTFMMGSYLRFRGGIQNGAGCAMHARQRQSAAQPPPIGYPDGRERLSVPIRRGLQFGGLKRGLSSVTDAKRGCPPPPMQSGRVRPPRTSPSLVNSRGSRTTEHNLK